ncbi:MAG TPA: hypothetical protein VE983_12295, partial [Solirubrobacteraceae bacterium]|nr:hypothetical protein [Solirubrobacteraceae bacterium]
AIQEHRQEAETRVSRAEEAEQRARIAEQEAQQQRAAAQRSQEKAGLHEEGLADHELIDESERERFAGTSAVESPAEEADRPAGRR